MKRLIFNLLDDDTPVLIIVVSAILTYALIVAVLMEPDKNSRGYTFWEAIQLGT